MDPLGLTLENFDGVGTYRTVENGARIDASGSLDGMDFRTPEGLAQALHDHPQTPPEQGDGQSAPVDHGNSATKVVLGVSDIATVAARLKAAGYPVGEVAEHGPYKVLWVKDPDGYPYDTQLF